MSTLSAINDSFKDDLVRAGFTLVGTMSSSGPIIYTWNVDADGSPSVTREVDVLVTENGFTFMARFAPVEMVPEATIALLRDPADGYTLTQLPGIPPNRSDWAFGTAVSIVEIPDWESRVADENERLRMVGLTVDISNALGNYADALMQRHTDKAGDARESAFSDLQGMLNRINSGEGIGNGISSDEFLEIAEHAFQVEPSFEAFQAVYTFIDGRSLVESARIGEGPYESVRQGLLKIQHEHGWNSPT